LKNNTCYQPDEVTNVDALGKNYIENNGTTLQSIKDQLKNTTLPTLNCSTSTPLFNGKKCVGCPKTEFYLLSNSTCYKAKNVTNLKAL
jgi:hypothetical protein